MAPLAVLLLLALAHAATTTAPDGQCGTETTDSARGADDLLGWRINTSHSSAGCNLPLLDAAKLPRGEVVRRLAAADTPLLIRGLLDLPDWRAQASAFGNRSALIERFSHERMALSVGALLSHGPESTQLDGKKLSFMQQAWGAVPDSVLGDHVQQQVATGTAKPQVELGDWLAALREGTAPTDAYVFQNVSGGLVAQALLPLHALWRDTLYAQFERRQRSQWPGTDPPALTRLGVGGSGSGAPFHDHDVIALNVAFAGRKRWLITRPCRPNCKIPFREGGAAVYHPSMLLSDESAAPTALRFLGEGGGDTWDCTQYPGEVVFVPEGLCPLCLSPLCLLSASSLPVSSLSPLCLSPLCLSPLCLLTALCHHSQSLTVAAL